MEPERSRRNGKEGDEGRMPKTATS